MKYIYCKAGNILEDFHARAFILDQGNDQFSTILPDLLSKFSVFNQMKIALIDSTSEYQMKLVNVLFRLHTIQLITSPIWNAIINLQMLMPYPMHYMGNKVQQPSISLLLQ